MQNTLKFSLLYSDYAHKKLWVSGELSAKVKNYNLTEHIQQKRNVAECKSYFTKTSELSEGKVMLFCLLNVLVIHTTSFQYKRLKYDVPFPQKINRLVFQFLSGKTLWKVFKKCQQSMKQDSKVITFHEFSETKKVLILRFGKEIPYRGIFPF